MGENGHHRVRLIMPDGEATIQVTGDDYILEAGEEAGLDLPYDCRAGVCTTCVGKLLEGKMDQEEGEALEEDELQEGFVLLCIGHALSDCAIRTHREDELYGRG
ncbi:2Fe-2S iron-sulfur cluster binding domain-containing protein [Rubrobacter tropicus]|uniref:2Fe-2S iron-sulfur cluster binding domain-containing protein n=1 Tax=Rubrobacter tropicus TaxID=2653851 RepID=A0A6G8QDW7_9ACTN|nr:2Fe-2S iron-sulfur cluster-binding protein [Rubrobacter tropicus]QIN84591.1 2Fe-2S iron-sulfur cluster binding domain-containing protein [Rubrobacter tropicus]